MGTGKGVAVFYNPDAVFSGDNFDCQQILNRAGRQRADPAGDRSGERHRRGRSEPQVARHAEQRCLSASPDGTEQVLHFTMENSPLPSNNVLSIAIDGVTGEVYMGTDQGIISYRGDAIEGAKDSDCAMVFPNPVRETYSGPVAITGLVADSDVRGIMDVAGNLVYRVRSLGGQAIWPATNMSGERVSTGCTRSSPVTTPVSSSATPR